MSVKVDINGHVVEFAHVPTPDEVDEAASTLGISKEGGGGAGFFREALATGAEIGGPIVGGIIGAAAGAPSGPGAVASALGGSAVGGAAGSALADKIRGQDVSGRKALALAAISAIPGGAAARVEGGLVKRALVGAAEGAGIGELATEVGTRIEEGRAPTTKERLTGAGAGAVFGGALNAAFGRRVRGGAADEAAKLAEGAKPDMPPLGHRRIVLPGEAKPAAEPVDIFGPDGKLLPAVKDSPTVSVSDTLRADFTRDVSKSVDALAKLPDETKNQRIFRQLQRSIEDGLFEPDETVDFLRRHDLSVTDFIKEWGTDISDAGKKLNRVSQIKKSFLRAAASDPALREQLDGLAIASKEADGWLARAWREVVDLDDVGRTAAIGQMATTHRNAVTQMGRLLLEVPVDTIEQGLTKSGIASKLGLGGGAGGNPFATIQGLIRASKPGDTERVLSLLEKIGPDGEVVARRLFGTSSFDVPFVPGAKTGRPFRNLPSRIRGNFRENIRQRRLVRTVLGPIADAASTYNQLQENFFRRAGFQAKLMQRAEEMGLTWEQVVENPGLLDVQAFHDATEHALQVSFAADPSGKIGKGFVKGMRSLQPVSTLFAPYPRYLTNFGKFFLDFNPAGTLRLLNSQTRAERGQEILAKGIVGALALGGATGLRLHHGGERWYELKGDDGKRYNVIGLAGPFLPYLFFGELIARHLRDGESRPIEGSDLAQGTVGIRLSPGTQAFLDAFAGRQDFVEASQKTVSEWVGRFTVPLRTFKDFAAAYGADREGVYYDPREVLELGNVRTTALNATVQNVPGAGEALGRPASVSAVTGQERTTEAPAVRQVLGLTERTVTPAAQEIELLGIPEFDLAFRTGIPKADRELNRRLGVLVQPVVNAIVANDRYRSLPPDARALILRRVFMRLREKASDNLDETNPQLAAAKRLARKFNETEKKAIGALGGPDIDELIYQAVKSAPGR